MRTLHASLLLALVAASAPAASPDALFKSGRQAMQQGDAGKAAGLFEQAVKLQPGNAEYHFWLGSALGRMAREASLFKQASLARKTKAEFERAVELDPNHLEARFALLDYYSIAPGIMGGDMSKAGAQALEIRKRDSLAGHRAFARLYARQKKPDLARKEFIDAIAEQPNSPKPRYYYAAALVGDRNYQGALQQIEEGLRIDPSYMPLHFQIGQVAALSGLHLPSGEEGLKKYLTHEPGEDEAPHARTWYWLGIIYEKQGRRAEAKQSFQTSLRLAPGIKEVIEALKRVS
jgi:tetratricopeptide (TPR) repeat protein